MFSFLIIPFPSFSCLLYQFLCIYNDIFKFPVIYPALVRGTIIRHRAIIISITKCLALEALALMGSTAMRAPSSAFRQLT